MCIDASTVHINHGDIYGTVTNVAPLVPPDSRLFTLLLCHRSIPLEDDDDGHMLIRLQGLFATHDTRPRLSQPVSIWSLSVFSVFVLVLCLRLFLLHVYFCY